jgi:hypothetical protein
LGVASNKLFGFNTTGASMILFEATNGMEGMAYVRRYVWASDESRARELLREACADDASKWKLKLLMRCDSAEFVTDESSEGWESANYPAP